MIARTRTTRSRIKGGWPGRKFLAMRTNMADKFKVRAFYTHTYSTHKVHIASIQALSRMSGYGRMRRKTEEAREGLDHYDLNTVNVVIPDQLCGVWPRSKCLTAPRVHVVNSTTEMAYPAVAAEKVDAAIAFSLDQAACDELQLKTEQRKALSVIFIICTFVLTLYIVSWL